MIPNRVSLVPDVDRAITWRYSLGLMVGGPGCCNTHDDALRMTKNVSDSLHTSLEQIISELSGTRYVSFKCRVYIILWTLSSGVTIHISSRL